METVYPQQFQSAPMLHINFLSILTRHHTLTVSSLSVYRGADGIAYNITTAEIELVMRRAAATIYNLDPAKHKKQLSLWSSHSLRVGSCATLYSKGFSEMEMIKYLLCWKSDACMQYLRKLAVTSRRHNTAINETSEVPNFV
jgi:hypothetical protein